MRSATWLLLLAWTVGLWIAALTLAVGQFFTTLERLPSDTWLASGAAVIAAILATVGTIGLGRWKSG